jgi:hypothetical protein
MSVSRFALIFSGAILVGCLAGIEAARAECVPLKAVGVSGDDGATLVSSGGVKKSISPAPLGIVAKSNWNTDFAIANSDRFNSYQVQIVPDSDGQYDVVAYLKYPNEKDQNVYENKGVSLGKGKALIFDARPSSTTINPYQLNVNFGGALSTGKSYTVRALGCT